MPRRKGARRALAKLICRCQYQSKLRPEHSLAGVFRSRLPPDSIRPNHQRLANPGPKRRGAFGDSGGRSATGAMRRNPQVKKMKNRPERADAPALTLAARAAANPLLLLDRAQVEAIFGLSKRWLELAAHRGEGPAMLKISRRMVRYRAGDVTTWLAARRVNPEEAA